MHRVLILYLPPKDPQASREYFVNTHIPLAAKMPGQRTMRYSFDVAAAEAFFADGVILVEGDGDKAILEGATGTLNSLAVAGVAVAAASGKTKMLIPNAILDRAW